MNSISLEELLKSQSFLSDLEVARLVDYCKLPTIINPRVSSDLSIMGIGGIRFMNMLGWRPTSG